MRDRATVLESGQGKLFSARGSAMFFKATRASTNGAFSLMERTLPPGGRKPPPHIHTNCEEAFYVLDGEVEFILGNEVVVGRRDSFVLVPGGVAHTFGNAGAVQASASSLRTRRQLDARFMTIATLSPR